MLGSFLLSLPSAPGETVDEPSMERPGAVIGPYKLLEQIGEGGFGVVFMAEQQQPIRRKVALKVLKPGMDTRQVIARFEAERQALALMDHPNIAKVLDAGQTATGRPYFVMELVKGVPITDYCDQAQLTPRERLGLFIPVCQAVQHAHQKGIIHRDLKPSNVLVSRHDTTPIVKVIDFGVAKALGQELTDKTLFTGIAQMIGTPLYMSPEQAGMSDLDIDTRSDIYSLGVLLYELLTGTTPFDQERLRTMGYDEIRRIIREEEPPKPSTRISTLGQAATTVSTQRRSDPKQLSQLCRGELDWIVMKALEKDRNRRYETASAFAADLQRYLHDEPVLACPPSAGYRLRKFMRRNKGPMAVVCAVFLVLVAGIIATTWGFLTARAARDAEAAQRKAADDARQTARENFTIAKKAVADYLTKVTEDPDLKRADFNKLRKRLLEAALPFYQRLAEQKPGNATLEAERGRAYYRLCVLRSDMGETTAALADCEQMRTIFVKLAADFPTEPEYRYDLAHSHYSVGYLLKVLGRHDQAEAAYRTAITIQENLAADFPAVPEYRHSLALSHNGLGILLAAHGERKQAEAAYRAALAIQDELVADFPNVLDSRETLSHYQNNLGNLLAEQGQRHQAESAYRAALTIADKLVADFPNVPRYRRESATTRNNLGNLLARMGRRDQAEAAHRAAVAIREKLAADFPTVPQYRRDLVGTLNNLGNLLVELGKRDKAETAYRAAVTIEEKLAADFPTEPKYRERLAASHSNLGVLLAGLGKHDQAEMAYRAPMTVLEKLAADFPTVPEYAVILGVSYFNLGGLNRDRDAQKALEWYRQAIHVLGAVMAKDNGLIKAREALRNAHWGRAYALDKLNRHAEAVKDWDRAIELDEGPNRRQFRMSRALSLARAADHARAVSEANELAQGDDVNAAVLYDLACVCSLASAAVTPAASNGKAESEKLKEQYAARALELLRQAVPRGWMEVAHMKKDTDLTPLRQREEFKKLMAELEANQKTA
jgi:serine/threonine protein kinase/tetratricopeptide (TPR) repeat protein